MTTTPNNPNPSRAEAEVVELVSSLIRFDTSNTGELETTKGERACAEWVAAQLQEVGYETEYVESGAPGRGNVFARLKGAESGRGALMLHGHLDVVPAEPADWSVHPLPAPSRTVTSGARRRGHEGHGRDDPGHRQTVQGGRRRTAA